eukprot:scaffold32577_cov146-Isochrysis_galbana.AAC.1
MTMPLSIAHEARVHRAARHGAPSPRATAARMCSCGRRCTSWTAGATHRALSAVPRRDRAAPQGLRCRTLLPELYGTAEEAHVQRQATERRQRHVQRRRLLSSSRCQAVQQRAHLDLMHGTGAMQGGSDSSKDVGAFWSVREQPTTHAAVAE